MQKIVLITGASRGIGKETALKFNSYGYKVIGTYNQTFSTVEDLKCKGIDMIKTDISSVADVENLFNYVCQKYKKIDLVINNAGIFLEPKFILDINYGDINSIIDVNLKGTIYCTQNAVKNMLFSGGKIINISSVFSVDGGSCESIYSASKAGIIGFTSAISKEVKDSSLQISTVLLGLIDTDMNSHLTNEEKLEFINSYGIKKIPTAKDVANRLYKLANLENINGKTFKIFVGSKKA